MPTKIFISYSHERPTPTHEVVALLEGAGYQTFWDTKNLIAGEDYSEVIKRELNAASAAIVIWSPQSVKSKWVRSEARHGARRGVLITLRTNDLEVWDIPKPFGEYHTGLVDDHNAILAAVRRVAGPASPASNQQIKSLPPSNDAEQPATQNHKTGQPSIGSFLQL
jgi:TIR domain